MAGILVHPILCLGCGCSFVGIELVTGGTEPTRPCRQHLAASYNGVDISFPRPYNNGEGGNMAAVKLVITVEFEPTDDATDSDVEYLIGKAGEVISDEFYNTGLTTYRHYDTLRVLCTTSAATECCITHRRMTSRHAKISALTASTTSSMTCVPIVACPLDIGG